MRRSAMSATSAMAMPSKSSHRAGPWPWKLPPERPGTCRRRFGKMSGLSVAALIAALKRPRTKATASSAARAPGACSAGCRRPARGRASSRPAGCPRVSARMLAATRCWPAARSPRAGPGRTRRRGPAALRGRAPRRSARGPAGSRRRHGASAPHAAMKSMPFESASPSLASSTGRSMPARRIASAPSSSSPPYQAFPL